MNTDDTCFDRLVDEELSEEERRQLLGQLDDEPGGWRRCAIAFLEAQCWRQALGETPSRRDSLSAALDTGTKNAGGTPALPVETPQRSAWLGRLKIISAMAASFLVALWLGSMAHQVWMGRTSISTGGSNNEIAKTVKELRPLVSPTQPDKELASAPGPTGAADPWKIVTVSAPSDGKHPQSSIQVPAVERNNLDEQWVRSVPPAIPENVLQALARTGHQVEQQREFVPVSLKDGRRLVMPVDRVNVHFVGNGPY